jgi:hypothetical protein
MKGHFHLSVYPRDCRVESVGMNVIIVLTALVWDKDLEKECELRWKWEVSLLDQCSLSSQFITLTTFPNALLISDCFALKYLYKLLKKVLDPYALSPREESWGERQILLTSGFMLVLPAIIILMDQAAFVLLCKVKSVTWKFLIVWDWKVNIQIEINIFFLCSD